jgi:hypothetical protein
MNNQSPLTPEERERLNWCLEVLEEEHIVECQDEAEGIAYREAMPSAAYSDLLPLLVKLRAQELREQAECRCTH